MQYRTIEADCYEPDLVDVLARATGDLDVGLVISTAGTGEPGEFLEHDRQSLLKMARLNALSHLEIAHHFGARLVQRGRGGLLFGGAMGAIHGLPFMAGDSASKAFVQTLGEALHFEFQPRGVNVTVLVIGPTDTAIIQKFGLTPRQMPMKPMTAEQCAREGILALVRNQATHIPGRINRVMNALMPASMIRRMTDKVLRAGAANAGLAVGEATAT